MKLSAIAMLCVSFLVTNTYAANEMSTQANTGAQTNMQTSEIDSKTAGQEFLANNKSQPGVITLPDGLQYKVIIEGTGSKPKDSDIVTVNYSGKLINGTEFDSSYKRGQPISFPVTGVIPGWTEALKLMKVGSIWELYIPSELAYGEHGAPPVIGPNETLIFKVELLAINK